MHVSVYKIATNKKTNLAGDSGIDHLADRRGAAWEDWQSRSSGCRPHATPRSFRLTRRSIRGLRENADSGLANQPRSEVHKVRNICLSPRGRAESRGVKHTSMLNRPHLISEIDTYAEPSLLLARRRGECMALMAPSNAHVPSRPAHVCSQPDLRCWSRVQPVRRQHLRSAVLLRPCGMPAPVCHRAPLKVWLATDWESERASAGLQGAPLEAHC